MIVDQEPFRQINKDLYHADLRHIRGPHRLEEKKYYFLRLQTGDPSWRRYAVDHAVQIDYIDEPKPIHTASGLLLCVGVNLSLINSVSTEHSRKTDTCYINDDDQVLIKNAGNIHYEGYLLPLRVEAESILLQRGDKKDS